jgi:DNA-binding MarR family transcriptional regulator
MSMGKMIRIFLLREQKRDLKDRRASRLIITPKGEELYKKVMKPAKELPDRVLSVLSREELLTLTSLLEKVREKNLKFAILKIK